MLGAFYKLTHVWVHETEDEEHPAYRKEVRAVLIDVPGGRIRKVVPVDATMTTKDGKRIKLEDLRRGDLLELPDDTRPTEGLSQHVAGTGAAVATSNAGH